MRSSRAASGCACSLLPHNFPPVATARYCFHRWRDSGLLSEINRALVAQARQPAVCNARSTAGVLDSQSVNISENTSVSGFGGRRLRHWSEQHPER